MTHGRDARGLNKLGAVRGGSRGWGGTEGMLGGGVLGVLQELGQEGGVKCG